MITGLPRGQDEEAIRGRLERMTYQSGPCRIWRTKIKHSTPQMRVVQVAPSKESRVTTRSAPWVVWWLETGEALPPGTEVQRLCGNRRCVAFKHLVPVRRGEKPARPRSTQVLTPSQVTHIRRAAQQGQSMVEVARALKAPYRAVLAAANGRTFKYVDSRAESERSVVDCVRLHTSGDQLLVSVLIEGHWHELDNVIACAVNADADSPARVTLSLVDAGDTRLDLDLTFEPGEVTAKSAG